ncbi:MAG TPA: extracellular solute-binding protein [Actinomycetota bacterium]|nr:extracellular solute-binding protein [Actinomycetota bacterium]
MAGRETAIVAAASLVLAACGAEPEAPPKREPVETLDAIGDPEGSLRLLALAGYVEDGSTDPDIDWVTPFEQRTGCLVDVRYADSPEEVAVSFLTEPPGSFDGVTAPGVAAGLLIAAGAVAPVDPALFPGFAHVLAPLRPDAARHYVVGNDVYGVPALYGPTLLLFDRARVRPAPRSWGAVFDPDPRQAGRIGMYDSPIAIADAALYVAVRDPELGIQDPYALTPRQLDAVTDVLADQEPDVGRYWTLLADQVDAFREGEVTVGSAWPIVFTLLETDRASMTAIVPSEGTTGWADTWMVAADAPHPNCMLEWMRWSLRADVQAQMALWYGAAPSNARACDLLRRELGAFAPQADTLRFGRCGDESFLASLALWRLPSVECGDGRGRACTGYEAWQLRWRSIRDR